MEKHLFSITFMLNCFVLLLSFTGVISAPVPAMITNVMKNDVKLCNASKFLYDSKYTEPCTSLEYPTALPDFTPNTVDSFLCLGVYDTAYKICKYSSRLPTFFNSTSISLYIDSLVPGDNEERFEEDSQQEFCKTLGGLTLLYNKTSSYLETLIKNLNNLDKCKRICFDFNNNLHPLCAVLGWIKSVENNMEKPNHNSIAPAQSIVQSYELSKDKTSGANKISKEEIGKQTTTDFKDNSIKVKQNMSDNISNTNTKPYSIEKETSNEGSVKTQKAVVDNTPIKADKGKNTFDDKSGTNVEDAQFNKIVPTNNEVSSKNNAENNVPNKVDVNEGKSEDLKKQNIDDVKTSTISENTQDHYDTSLEEEIETEDGNDADDTVQQSNMGNPNEEIHVQETFEKNNLRFSNLRTEDDSHFFTYFTVIIMMCIIGYIGYCNKQKIFAIVLEGRRSKNNRGRRRPSTASYRKLDCTLEEAVTSQCNANVTHVIY
nr:PREDICTED: trans-Golgi network integral membrane protein 1-like [Linepithema humile]